MKKIIAILLFTAAMISLNVSAQEVDAKIATRVQKETVKVAEAFSLSEADTKKFEKILYTRFVEQKPAPGMTEQEKYDRRKAGAIAFRKNLEEAFGKSLGTRMAGGYSANIVRKQGTAASTAVKVAPATNGAAAAPQTADEKLKAKVQREAAMVAAGLNLTKEEADKYEKILYQRFVDMRAITKDMTEEEKFQIRKAAVVKANAALDETFGKTKANQMKAWYTNNIVKKNNK